MKIKFLLLTLIFPAIGYTQVSPVDCFVRAQKLGVKTQNAVRLCVNSKSFGDTWNCFTQARNAGLNEDGSAALCEGFSQPRGGGVDFPGG